MSNRFDFQGEGKRTNYFEGWYVKCTDRENDLSIALIPGVSHFSDSQSFVQYNIHYKNKSYSGKINFDRNHFEVVPEPYSIIMPKFVLSESGVKASLIDEDNHILLDFSFGPLQPIRQTAYMPSIMGPLEYIKVPCSHDIVSMKHTVKGKLVLNGEEINVDSGVGYMEKDRGSTFPSNYLWLQTNTFTENSEASLSLAVATIEKKPLKITGFYAVFNDGIKEHRFSTYLGSRFDVVVDNNEVGYSVQITGRNKILEVKVELSNVSELIAPMNEGMDFPIKETVKSSLEMTFKEKGKAEVKLTSENAAAELVNWV